MRADSIFYLENTDTAKVLWASSDRVPDAWTKQFFRGPVDRADMSNFFPLDEPFIAGPAASADLTPPDIKTLNDVTLGDERFLRLSITSPRQARVVWISVPQGEVLEGSIDGKPIPAGAPVAHRAM